MDTQFQTQRKYYFVVLISLLLTVVVITIIIRNTTLRTSVVLSEKALRTSVLLSEKTALYNNSCLVFLKEVITAQKLMINKQARIITELNLRLSRKQNVTITFYHPPSRGINSDKDHKHTATMTRPTVGRTVAISDKLFNQGWLGSKIYIEGYGIYIVEDRMSSTVTGECIDICVKSRKKAMQLGKVYNVVAIRLL